MEDKTSAPDVAISNRPVPPPIWAALPTDQALFPRPRPVRVSPGRIALGREPSCLCRPPTDDIIITDQVPGEINARLYTIVDVQDVEVQIYRCPCPNKRCNIGPDTRTLGIFNYNNSKLFTHELLDEYTSLYTVSETPFHAFVVIMNRRYQTSGANMRFVTPDEFRAVWFAYARLLVFDHDFQCVSCGPHPKEVVFDGMVLAFSKIQRLASLRPPTTIDERYSPIRAGRRYPKSVRMIHTDVLRKDMLKVLRAPLWNGEDGGETPAHLARLQRIKNGLNSTQYISGAGHLTNYTYDLATVWEDTWGSQAYLARRPPIPELKRLFLQVRPTL